MKRVDPPATLVTQTPGKALPNGKLLKRAEAARRLGVSVSTLRRWEGTMVKPIIGPDGVRQFEESELEATMLTVRHQKVVSSLGPSAGDIAADVFGLLDDGVHVIEIVKRLHLAPDVVSALQDQWARMRGGFVVDGDEARALGKIAGTRPPKSATNAIANLEYRTQALMQMRSGSERCQNCRQKTACVCELCAVQLRGSLATLMVKLEVREVDGVEEVRVFADVVWADQLDVPDGDQIATLRSDWCPRPALAKSEMATIVDEIEQRNARWKNDPVTAATPVPRVEGQP